MALAAAAGLAGCADEGRVVGEHPADWDQGAPLVAFQGWRYHSADEGQRLYAPGAGPAPERCVAYQDATARSTDRCEVEGPRQAWNEQGEQVTRGPWTLNATWDGAGEDLVATERDPSRRTVVAFDGEDRPAFFWDGIRREGPMAIE